MALLNERQFSKTTRSYRYDNDVQKQIREFITTAMMPVEDVLFCHCIVIVVYQSKGFLFNNNKMYMYNSKTYQGTVYIKHLMNFQVPNPRIICKLSTNCENLAIGIISAC